jgi:hypothetical protein
LVSKREKVTKINYFNFQTKFKMSKNISMQKLSLFKIDKEKIILKIILFEVC